MNNVENRIVEMKFDNEQFEAAVAKTMDTLDKFKQKLNFEDAGKGMEKLGKASSNYQYSLNDIGQSLDQLNGRFSAMGTIGRRVLENLTDKAVNFATKGIGGMFSGITSGGLSRAMNLEQARFQMQGIYKDASKVKSVIYDDILPELQGTPYSLDQAAVVIGQLGASGLQSSEQIREATRAIAGLAAMSGRGFDEVGRIFSKVAGQGAMMGGELQQLSTYGINAAADIAKYFNGVMDGSYKASKQVQEDLANILEATDGVMDEASIRDVAKSRLIKYQDMAAAMDTLYGEHAKKSTEMYTGALEDLKAALARIGAEPAAVGLEVLRNAFNALVPAVDAVNAVLKPFTNATKDVVTGANGEAVFGGQMYGTLAKEVQGLGLAFANLFVQMDENGKITRWSADSIEEYSKSLEAMEASGQEVLQWQKDYAAYASAGDAVMNPNTWRIMTASTQAFVNVLKAVRNVIEPIARGIASAFPKLTLETIANMTEGIERFTSHLILSGDNMERLRWITQGIFTPISLAFQGLVALAKGLIKVLANVYQAISPVLNAIFAFASSVGKTISGMGDAISYLLSDAAGFAKFVARIAIGIAQFLRLDKALGLIQLGFSKLAVIFDDLGYKIRDFAQNAIPRIHDFINSVGEMLHVKEAVEAIKAIFENFRKSLSKAFHIESIVEGFKQFADSLRALFETDNLFGKLLDNLKNFLEWLGDLIPYQKIVEKVSSAFDRLATSVGRLTKKPAGAIKQFFIDRANDIKEFIKNLDKGNAFQVLAKSMIPVYKSFKNIQSNFKQIIKPLGKSIAELIPKLFGFKTFGDMVQTVAAKIASAIKVFLEFIGILGGIARAKTSEQVSKLSDSLSNLFDTKILAGAKALGKSLSMTGEGFAAGLVKVGEWIKDTLTNMSPASVKKFIYTVMLLILAYRYMGMLRSLKWAGEAFAGLLKNFGSLMNGLSSGFGLRTLNTAIANTVKLTGLATALLIFAGAVFILGKMNWQTVLLGSSILLAAMLSYLGIMKVLNKLDVDKNGAEKVRNLALSMAAIGGGCLLLVEAIKQISSVWDREHPDKLIASLLSIIVLMFSFVAAARVLGGIDGAKNTVALGKASFAIIGIAQGMKMMAEACEAFGNVDPDHFEQGLEAIIMIMAFFSLFAASVKAGAKVFSAAAGMMVLAATLMVIQKVLDTFGNMDTKVLQQGGNAVGTILAGLTAFSLIAGRAEKGIFGAAVGMVAVAGSIMIIADAMNKIGSLDEGQFAQALASLITIFVGFSAIAKYSGGAKGAAAGGSFLMMAAGILALAYALQVLASTNPLALLGGMAEMIVMCAAVAAGIAILKVAIESLDLEDAANLALIGAGLFLLASAIGTLAAVPLAALAVAILGLAGALIVIGLAMSVFSAIGPGLLVVAGAFALLGVAALFVGAGLMFLTLALASLIPLILSLSVVDQQALIQGLQVLGTVAKSLADMFFTLAKGVLAFGAACIVSGIGLVLIGAGLAAIGVGAGLAALGVALFAGALALLAITIQKFFGGGLLEMIAGGFESFAGGFGGLVKGLWQKIKGDSVKEAGTTGEEMGKAMQDGAVNGATSKQDQVTNALTGGPEDALSEIKGMYPEFSTSGGDLNSMLTQGFGDGTPLSDALGGDLSQFSSLLGNQELDAYMKANGISGALGNGYDSSEFLKQIDQTKKDTSAKLSTIPGIASKEGAKTGSGLASGERSKRGDVVSATASLNSAAKPADQSGSAYRIGSGIASGLASGISMGSWAVKSAAQTAVNNAIAAAKSAAQVNSPSKRTIPIGSAIGEGLVVGMNRSQRMVTGAAHDLTDSGINAVTTAMQQAASLFDTNMDFTPTITPVVDLSEVRQSATGINSILGGNFGLSTPYSGFVNAQMAAAAFQNGSNPAEFEAISKLAKEIGSMNETMNARQLVNNIHIEGSEDPDAFADRLTRRFRLNARTI